MRIYNSSCDKIEIYFRMTTKRKQKNHLASIKRLLYTFWGNYIACIYGDIQPQIKYNFVVQKINIGSLCWIVSFHTLPWSQLEREQYSKIAINDLVRFKTFQVSGVHLGASKNLPITPRFSVKTNGVPCMLKANWVKSYSYFLPSFHKFIRIGRRRW